MRVHAVVTCGIFLGGCSVTPPGPDAVARAADPEHVAIWLETEPPGARCVLAQGGQLVATVEDTPGETRVPRKETRLAIACSKTKYLDEVAEVDWIVKWDPLFPGLRGAPGKPLASAMGTAAAGAAFSTGAAVAGISGAAVGAGTAAAAVALAPLIPVVVIGGPILTVAMEAETPRAAYPTAVSLTLTPAEFPSEDAREAYFAPIIERAESEVRQRTEGICRYVGETHAQCLKARTEEPGRIGNAGRAVRESYRARTRIATP